MKIVKSLGKQPPTANSRYKTEFVIVECPHCLTEFRAQKRSIVSGHTKSCGCLKKVAAHMITTGPWRAKQPRLYRIWKNMRTRCSNPNIPLAKNYGLRGISYTPEWDDFTKFYAWAMGAGYADNLTLDRIDVDGHYSPSNCRWATSKQQAENTRLLRSTNTSGYRGVHPKGRKFAAKVTKNGTRVYLGTFDKASDAAQARDAYVTQHGIKTPLNFFLGSSAGSKEKTEALAAELKK
jgi:hypothetical protein